MIKARAVQAGIDIVITFRAVGITTYLERGSAIKKRRITRVAAIPGQHTFTDEDGTLATPKIEQERRLNISIEPARIKPNTQIRIFLSANWLLVGFPWVAIQPIHH
jgi:hypothetical protein